MKVATIPLFKVIIMSYLLTWQRNHDL